MLAISVMSPTATAIFFIIAFFALAVAAVLSRPISPMTFLCGGLAAWMLVLAWDALAAT